jgi:hypothetical protein
MTRVLCSRFNLKGKEEGREEKGREERGEEERGKQRRGREGGSMPKSPSGNLKPTVL